MSKSNVYENALLLLIFNNTPITLVGDASGILGSAAAGSLYVSLHTADPGEAGDQTTSEAAYTGYARTAAARTSGAWTVAGNSVSPAADITFPIGTAGSGTATHFGVGTSSTGAGKLLYSGTLTPNVAMGAGVTPRVTTASTITED